MAPILVITKNQKVLFGYVVISMLVINKTKTYLLTKKYLINKHITKKNFLRINRLVFNFYIYTVLKKALTMYEQYLLVGYLLQFFNSIEFILFNFIWYYLKILIFNFGYCFYVVCINPCLHVFSYLFPSFILKLNDFLFFLINHFKYNLVILKSQYQVLIFSFSRQISEIILVLFNSSNLIDSIFYTIKFALLFLEIILALSLTLIVPPIREAFFRGFKGWNFNRISLVITNYIDRWFITFSAQKNVWNKIIFALMTIVSWLIFSILVIRHFIYIWTLIKSSIESF